MQITVTGKQIDIGDSLRQHVQARLDEISQKFFERSIESTVHFCHEKAFFRTDIHMQVPGLLLVAHAAETEIYAAFDSAVAKLTQRLKRYKNRLKDHHKNGESIRTIKYVIENTTESTQELPALDKNQPDAPTVIAEMETEIQTLSVSQAVMHMDLADVCALLFRNSAHGGLNMVYRRSDGHIGWVDPAAGASMSKNEAAA